MQYELKELDRSEKQQTLVGLKGRNVWMVVLCGGYQVIHAGTVVDINEAGTVVAISCPGEKFRNEYTDSAFTQHERQRDGYGNLIRPKDKYQYVPIELIRQVIDYNTSKKTSKIL